MTNKTELLPCPFCGREPRYVPADYVDTNGEPWPFAECDTCNTGAPVEFWNTRVAPAEDVRAVVDEPVYLFVNDNGDNSWTDEWGVAKNLPFEVETAYRHPQRLVVMPERLDESQYRGTSLLAARRWNACLDEVARLNPE